MASKKTIETSTKNTASSKGHGNTPERPPGQLDYGVTERPPVVFIVLLALQQSVVTLSATLTVVYVINKAVCGASDDLFFSKLISTSIFMCGIVQILDVTIGIRLPLLQGSQPGFLTPVIAMMQLPKWSCPDSLFAGNISTSGDVTNVTEQLQPAWTPRINELSGGLILASVGHMIIGATGVMGFLMRFIGPLTIAPTIALIGLGMIPVIVTSCQTHWGVAATTIVAVMIFSIFMGGVPICIPFIDRNDRKCRIKRVYIFRMVPILLGIGVGWLLSFILTSVGFLSDDPSSSEFRARTDARSSVIEKAQWVFFPYPLQFGTPTFSVAMFMGMTAASLCSVIGSVGAYSAVGDICDVSRAPPDAINRALTVSGISNVLAGVFGTGHGYVAFNITVVLIGITKVASRIVWATTGILMVVFGVFGKFGALLATIPDPVIGGYLAVAMSMLVGSGIGSLHSVNLQYSRNAMILGVSIMTGLFVPHYLHSNPKAGNVGIDELDQVLAVILKTPMFIGGVLAFILDNTVPGTRRERGFISETKKDDIIMKCKDPREVEVGIDTGATEDIETNENTRRPTEDVYALPGNIIKLFERLTCCKYSPVSPTFRK